MAKEWNKSFEIIVGVLLNISLATFLLILVERVNDLKGFIFDTVILTIIYVGTMYYLTYDKKIKNHFLIPRTLIVILLSMFPYMVLRTYVEGVEVLPGIGVTAYLISLLILGIIWGIWEGSLKGEKFNIKEGIFNVRTIVFFIILIIVIGVLMNGGNILT